jgi:hypothetical protein
MLRNEIKKEMSTRFVKYQALISKTGWHQPRFRSTHRSEVG